GNKILSHSTDREHPEGVDRKKITKLQIQKMKDQQKTLDQKRISKSEEAKELIKKSKQANQKAQKAIEGDKNRHAKSERHQKENNGPDLSKLINKAKISEQEAKVALQKYNDLRLSDTAVEKYNTKVQVI